MFVLALNMVLLYQYSILTFSCVFIFLFKDVVWIIFTFSLHWRFISLMNFMFWWHIHKFISMRRRFCYNSTRNLSANISWRNKCISGSDWFLGHISIESSILVLLDNHFERRLIDFKLILRMTKSLLKILSYLNSISFFI